MNAIGKVLVVALAGLVSAGSIEAASAHTMRRHRVAHHIVQHFVFASPGPAAVIAKGGYVGSLFETGLLGASTADPYETPAFGYDGNGYYGPGFAYPGY